MFIAVYYYVIARACPKQSKNVNGLLRYFVARNDDNGKLI